MKKSLLPIFSILLCVLIAVTAYFWATGLMASLYAFRSPLKDNLPQAGKPTGAPLARRVVAIMVDGLRTDIAADPTVMPFLNSLRSRRFRHHPFQRALILHPQLERAGHRRLARIVRRPRHEPHQPGWHVYLDPG